MPKVVPSQVVSLIEQTYPQLDSFTPNTNLDSNNGPILTCIVDLAEQIPIELIVLTGERYSGFRASVATIRYCTTIWIHRGASGVLAGVSGFNRHALLLLRDCLRECPDEGPTTSTAGLEFIDDDNYRRLLRNDFSAAHSAYSNGEWKAATVLAGSIIEALLLWALEKKWPR